MEDIFRGMMPPRGIPERAVSLRYHAMGFVVCQQRLRVDVDPAADMKLDLIDHRKGGRRFLKAFEHGRAVV